MICFVKCGRFLLQIVEYHFDDYMIERLKEVNAENGRPLEALSLMMAYNGEICFNCSCIHLRDIFPYGELEQHV